MFNIIPSRDGKSFVIMCNDGETTGPESTKVLHGRPSTLAVRGEVRRP